MGNSAFDGLICKSASNAAAGLPNIQLISFVTPRTCSSPMNLPQTANQGIEKQNRRLPLVPTMMTAPDFVKQFQQNRRKNRHKPAQSRHRRQPEPNQSSIDHREQQHEPAEELRVQNPWNTNHFGSCLRHSEPDDGRSALL